MQPLLSFAHSTRMSILRGLPGAMAALTLMATYAHGTDKPTAHAPAAIPASEIAAPPGLPSIGKWMIDKDGSIAHWLGQIVDGKHLHEPINVILIDTTSTNPDDARKKLTAAATAAGYPVRFGHSTGYRGFIGGDLYSQIPRGWDDAFSNRVFEETNNHGRIFGPHASEHGLIFIGAFSRESVNFLHDPPHRYASFNAARDDFARALAAHSAFRQTGTTGLGNAVVGDPKITTGDHDSLAVVLRLDQ